MPIRREALASVVTPAAAPIRSDEIGTELVARARSRARRSLSKPDGLTALVLAGGFLGAAVCGAFLLPPLRPFSPVAAVVALVVYAAVSRVRFEVSQFYVVPTQLVLVPM